MKVTLWLLVLDLRNRLDSAFQLMNSEIHLAQGILENFLLVYYLHNSASQRADL